MKTDTDSFCYHIKTDDVYEDLYVGRDLFDNSDYAEPSKFFFKNNKKVIGKFRDEAAGNPITEFVGLKKKMYSYKTETKRKKKYVVRCIYLLIRQKITRQLKVSKRIL